jgi:hypothetical protein
MHCKHHTLLAHRVLLLLLYLLHLLLLLMLCRGSPGDDYIEDDSYDNTSSFSGTSDDGRHKLWAVAQEYDSLLTTQLDEQQVRHA